MRELNQTISISDGNMKMGKILNISLPPIKTCNRDVQCSKQCYALKSYRQFPTVRKAWNKNLAILKNSQTVYFNSLTKTIARKEPKYFRWHVAGDIINQKYYNNMIKLANMFPNTKFLAFTKQYGLDYSERPSNLKVVISAWPNTEFSNKYDLPVAWMQDGTEERIPEDAVHCPSDCSECFLCFETDKSVYFTIH